MLSCHLCLLISCYSLVFWILSFDCSFCLVAWFLYILFSGFKGLCLLFLRRISKLFLIYMFILNCLPLGRDYLILMTFLLLKIIENCFLQNIVPSENFFFQIWYISPIPVEYYTNKWEKIHFK